MTRVYSGRRGCCAWWQWLFAHPYCCQVVAGRCCSHNQGATLKCLAGAGIAGSAAIMGCLASLALGSFAPVGCTVAYSGFVHATCGCFYDRCRRFGPPPVNHQGFRVGCSMRYGDEGSERVHLSFRTTTSCASVPRRLLVEPDCDYRAVGTQRWFSSFFFSGFTVALFPLSLSRAVRAS